MKQLGNQLVLSEKYKIIKSGAKINATEYM
jgi:hypothetical protein